MPGQSPPKAVHGRHWAWTLARTTVRWMARLLTARLHLPELLFDKKREGNNNKWVKKDHGKLLDLLFAMQCMSIDVYTVPAALHSEYSVSGFNCDMLIDTGARQRSGYERRRAPRWDKLE